MYTRTFQVRFLDTPNHLFPAIQWTPQKVPVLVLYNLYGNGSGAASPNRRAPTVWAAVELTCPAPFQ